MVRFLDLFDAFAVERAGLLKAVRKAYEDILSTPGVHEFWVASDKMLSHTRVVGKNYFLLVPADSGAHLGCIRFQAECSVTYLSKELS